MVCTDTAMEEERGLRGWETAAVSNDLDEGRLGVKKIEVKEDLSWVPIDAIWEVNTERIQRVSAFHGQISSYHLAGEAVADGACGERVIFQRPEGRGRV